MGLPSPSDSEGGAAIAARAERTRLAASRLEHAVIVESPAAPTIGKYLGRGYRVRATVGHIMDLPEKKLGIDIENGFHPDLVAIPGKEKTIAELKSYAKDSKEVLIATDPDREGEAIAQHVATQITPKKGAPKIPIRRVLFHEITKDAVQKAILNAVIDTKRSGQQARRVPIGSWLQGEPGALEDGQEGFVGGTRADRRPALDR